MAFDARKFVAAPFEPRTERVEFPELAEWFGDDDPVIVIRSLTGDELATVEGQCDDRAEEVRAGLTRALEGGNKSEIADAALDVLGFGGGATPKLMVRYHALIMAGAVSPVIDRQTSVMLGQRFPIDHRNIAHKIAALSGKGQEAKKKPIGSIVEQESETA